MWVWATEKNEGGPASPPECAAALHRHTISFIICRFGRLQTLIVGDSAAANDLFGDPQQDKTGWKVLRPDPARFVGQKDYRPLRRAWTFMNI